MRSFRIRIFAELEASEYLENQVKSLNNVVNSENEDYLLNVNFELFLCLTLTRLLLYSIRLSTSHR